jgi:hypothetical protein
MATAIVRRSFLSLSRCRKGRVIFFDMKFSDSEWSIGCEGYFFTAVGPSILLFIRFIVFFLGSCCSPDGCCCDWD